MKSRLSSYKISGTLVNAVFETSTETSWSRSPVFHLKFSTLIWGQSLTTLVQSKIRSTSQNLMQSEFPVTHDF